MAHGVGEVLSDGSSSVKIVSNSQHSQNHSNQTRKPVGVMGSRRIFAAAFKLKVLDSYRNDIDCRGNQRATARKYGIHRRQIQKWLQCEENLRSSCAESTTNTSVIVGSNAPSTSGVINTNGINIISTASISKTGEPTIVTTTSGINPVVPVVATSAPALNLSLARLHGDELANRQGPPPSSHPTLHRGCSPTSAQYNQHNVTSNSLPVHALLISYTEYPGQDLHHQQQQLLHHHPEDSGMHGYQIDRTGSPNERKYYVLNHPNYEQSAGYRGGSDARLYHQTQPPTYQPTSGHGYGSIVSRDHRVHGIHQSPGHVPSGVPLSNSSPSSHAHLRDVDSPGNESLAPAIKAERASPDSPATPVPCNEAPSSPGITTTTSTRTVYPVSQHTRIPSSGIATQAITAVHFETPRRTSPEAHVHVSVDTHTSTVDSKKQDHHSKLVYVKREDDRGIEVKDELPDVCVPKEEILEEHDDTNNAAVEDRDGYSADGFDYGAAPVLLSRASSDVHSGTLSPVRDANFSGPSSPRGAASSSSTSTSSCSDSEVDALDYSSNHQNTTGDLSRRRSFSLRFKLDVLDAFHGDVGVAGNQRATARKFGINRRQVQKWLGQETELRGEIALRGGDMRQRLGPLQELPGESAVDLRTGSMGRSDADMDHSSSPVYCCDSSSPRLGYYPSLADAEVQRTCTLSCCADNLTTSSVTSCYPDSKRACYPESQGSYYCYSPRDSLDNVPQDIEITSLPAKRTACNLSCCYDIPSPKRLCVESECSISNKESCQDQPPQEAPLCLVKSKRSSDASPLQTERVTSTVPTPPAPAALAQPTKKDGILFKPYLDNPVSKPTDDTSHHYYHQRDLSPLNNQQSVIVNNNNCSSICNLNEERGHDYAVELSLRVPVSWRAPSHVAEFPERIRSAFARYPAIPHYI